MTRQDVMESVRDGKVKFIRLQLTDIFGAFKNIAVTSEELERVMTARVSFDSSVVDRVSSSREQDIILKPDLSTFVMFPWRPRDGAVARFICDAVHQDGTAYPGCSRSILKQVVDEAARMGFEVRVGARVDFYLFYTDSKGNPTTDIHDYAGFCDLTPLDLGENARRDMVLTLEEMGFTIGSSHHGAGSGQHQISLKSENAVEAADKLATFKFIVRTIAQRHGIFASFMPKPFNGMPGSSMHLHLFLRGRGREYSINADEPLLFRPELGHFVGGVLTHARASTAITNPLINSYKRLFSSNETPPVYVAWSGDSRNTILRIVECRGQEVRVEVRNPDSTSNPYLALALIIKSGLEGISKKLPQPSPLTEYILPNNKNELNELSMDCLPRTLEEALRVMTCDQLVKSTLGEHIYRTFVRTKCKEWERFQSFVHPWELNEYLSAY